MNTTVPIAKAQSTAADARLAVQEFHEQLGAVDAALVLCFCSSDYDLDALAEEMNRRFPGVSVVGSTTAGEIGPAGYLEKSLAGVALPRDSFTAAVGFSTYGEQYGGVHVNQTLTGIAFGGGI